MTGQADDKFQERADELRRLIQADTKFLARLEDETLHYTLAYSSVVSRRETLRSQLAALLVERYTQTGRPDA